MKKKQSIAALKAGMDPKTARKYLRSGKLPSEMKKPHLWSSRPDPFAQDWAEIQQMLKTNPALQAKTVLDHFIERYPDRYNMSHMRTLHRRFQNFRALQGPDKDVMFLQKYEPGYQSQSDFTDMNKVGVTVQGQPFKHLLFHFKLSCSKWEWGSVCHSESFDNLSTCFEDALHRLGGVPQTHRTDNLSAAWTVTAKTSTLTERWAKLMAHYKITPTHNTPGESHENGIIEKSHDIFVNRLKQALMLRGSYDFPSVEAYTAFLVTLFQKNNRLIQAQWKEESAHLKPLPPDKWSGYDVTLVKVRRTSLVHIKGSVYSVPSRFIGCTLKAYLYREHIELFYEHRCIQTMPKLHQGENIDYRHIVASLLRKPGAFERYQYQAHLFPDALFRKAYDRLRQLSPANGHKDYLHILNMAKLNGEHKVQALLEQMLAQGIAPRHNAVQALLQETVSHPHEVSIPEPDLALYDAMTTALVLSDTLSTTTHDRDHDQVSHSVTHALSLIYAHNSF